MGLHSEHATYSSDFRRNSTLALAIAALLILTPFSINNFIHGRNILGAGSLGIVALVAYNCWNAYKDRYSSMFILISLVPAIIFFLLIAINQQGIIGILWCYPASLSFYMMLAERKAWVANATLLCLVIPFTWDVIEPSLAVRVTATLLTVSVFSAILIRVITVQQEEIHAHAIKDPLTGLLNRIPLESMLDQAIQQNRRADTDMSLLTIDVDHFKSINDAFGHETGDTVLQKLGELFRDRIRSVDKVFRLGGEEFLVLLFGADTNNSRNVAEELRHSVESLRILSGKSVTVSIGIASLQSGEDWKEWMKRSDENLYLAKKYGRNRVVV